MDIALFVGFLGVFAIGFTGGYVIRDINDRIKQWEKRWGNNGKDGEHEITDNELL